MKGGGQAGDGAGDYCGGVMGFGVYCRDVRYA